MKANGSFPATWERLRFPEMRSELICYLRDFSDVDYQRNHWLSVSSDPREAFNTLGNAIGEVVDIRGYDHDHYIDAAVGGELFDEAEAKAIKRLVNPLVRICHDLGEAPPERYFAHPHWPEVVEAAKLAYLHMKDR